MYNAKQAKERSLQVKQEREQQAILDKELLDKFNEDNEWTRISRMVEEQVSKGAMCLPECAINFQTNLELLYKLGYNVERNKGMFVNYKISWGL